MSTRPVQHSAVPTPERLVPPGETPPGEGTLSGAGPLETHNPAKGWATGPVVVMAVLTVMFAVYFLAWAFLM